MRRGPAGAPAPPLSVHTREARRLLIALGERYQRAGWLLGTSGNLSARVATPTGERLVVTASGRDKGHLGPEDFVELDLEGVLLAAGRGDAQSDPVATVVDAGCVPSAEAAIHLALYRSHPGARVSVHVHTVASTLAEPDGAFPLGDGPHVRLVSFAGVELIKGWDLPDEPLVAYLPVFPNWPQVPKIAHEIEDFFRVHRAPRVPALLIAHHGITAWGRDAFSANRHLEVTEFLCQVAVARGPHPAT